MSFSFMVFYVITTFQHKCNLCKLSIFLGVNVLEHPRQSQRVLACKYYLLENLVIPGNTGKSFVDWLEQQLSRTQHFIPS